MGYRWHDDAFRDAESRIEDLMLEVAELDEKLHEKEEEAETLSSLFLDCFFALRETSKVASDYFTATHPQVKRFV